ncbi:MAG: HEAT repeat domain-containing protein [Methylococcales bacterium]|nr:HEAT repeat domain-containing protein [Methylococcales bacterium]
MNIIKTLKKTITSFVQSIKKRKDLKNQMTVEKLLEEDSNEASIKPLINALPSIDDWTLQIKVIDRLIQLNALSATNQLAKLYHNNDLSIEVRGKAIEALASINYEKYSQLILEAFWYDGDFKKHLVLPAALALIEHSDKQEVSLYPDPVYRDEKIEVVFDRGRSSVRKHSSKSYRHACISNFTDRRIRVFGQHFSDSEIETVLSGQEDWLPISYAFANNSEYGYVDKRADQYGVFYLFFYDTLDDKRETNDKNPSFPIKPLLEKPAIIQFKFDIECYRELSQ